jgi:Ni/Fe-hydrogenase subunit HybB-like protein
VALALLSAVYTAFLFAQAEGRDLWQSPLLPWQLFVQAIMAGSAALLIAALFARPTAGAVSILAWTLGLSLAANLFITVAGEYGLPHASQVAAMAARAITRGRYRPYHLFALWAGLILPLALILIGSQSLPLLAGAGLLAIAGLFAAEWAFVMAPQDVPNS